MRFKNIREVDTVLRFLSQAYASHIFTAQEYTLRSGEKCLRIVFNTRYPDQLCLDITVLSEHNIIDKELLDIDNRINKIAISGVNFRLLLGLYLPLEKLPLPKQLNTLGLTSVIDCKDSAHYKQNSTISTRDRFFIGDKSSSCYLPESFDGALTICKSKN